MSSGDAGLVVWDIDGTLIPADLRWLRRAIARTYKIAESDVVFPDKKVHGYTDESIVVDAAVASGISAPQADRGVAEFRDRIAEVMSEGREELAEVQPPYDGAAGSIAELHRIDFLQTVLTGNVRSAAEVKLTTSGLDTFLDLAIGAFGSDDRDRFKLPDVVSRRYSRVYGHPLDPLDVVVIGDAPNDIACARHANFGIAVVAHRIGRDELATYKPDLILDDLDPQAVASGITSVIAARRDQRGARPH